MFVRENGFLVKSGGVDTLARIRGKATREKYKGNCTRPGMDVNSGDPSGRDNRPGLIVKKSRPAYRPEGSSVVAGELLARRPSEKSPQPEGRIDPFSRRPKKDCWQQSPPVRREGGGSFGQEAGRVPRAGISRNASSIVRHHPRSKRFESRGRKYMQLPWSNDKGRRQKLGTEPYDAEVSRTVP